MGVGWRDSGLHVQDDIPSANGTQEAHRAAGRGVLIPCKCKINLAHLKFAPLIHAIELNDTGNYRAASCFSGNGTVERAGGWFFIVVTHPWASRMLHAVSRPINQSLPAACFDLTGALKALVSQFMVTSPPLHAFMQCYHTDRTPKCTSFPASCQHSFGTAPKHYRKPADVGH